MVQKSETIWFNGKQVPWDEANVHVLTHALHYGTAVFEGIRAYECADGSSEVFRLHEHMVRLVNSAKILGLILPYTADELCEAAVETLKRNKLAGAYVRPLVFVGEGAMGVHPGQNPIETIIAAWPWGAYLGEEALEKGIKVKVSTFNRHHVNVMMTKAKASGNYVNSVLAKTEAVADGYDEAILLDTTGHVSEGSGENLFMVLNDIIYTPHTDGVLGGLTRDSIISLAGDLGAHHPRHALHRRRGLLHRHRRRADSHQLHRSPPDRQRRGRSGGQAAPDRVLQDRQGRKPGLRALALPLPGLIESLENRSIIWYTRGNPARNVGFPHFDLFFRQMLFRAASSRHTHEHIQSHGQVSSPDL
jgi:branched-chain amino acid aminotransferase